ncbi:MAG: glucose-6-phosphate dehydrogenase [Deltaproteobacteria bacterium]|nr:glucose-6-phosphate dehydrogenase [Deltaproteobacteria bacterium]
MKTAPFEEGIEPQPATASCQVEDFGIAPQNCLGGEPLSPCIIIIFGASGDLTFRKLIPALFRLHCNMGLPHPIRIVGCARTPMDDGEFRESLKTGVLAGGVHDVSCWDAFAACVRYRPLEYLDPGDYRLLARYLEELDEESGTQGNRIFYLAVPPALYETVSRCLGAAGLAQEGMDGKRWSRIVVEKPFGRDLESAAVLDRVLHENFLEHQVFRIDHYLAKETVQNVLMLRFANSIFEPVWNRQFIEKVKIIAAETLGVGKRAGYYEEAGVLRDMFQNHMMQLLSLTAMEPPSHFETELVRDEKSKVFRALRPFPVEQLYEFLVSGRYEAGIVDGARVPGYLEEPGVSSGSLTPTFASMKVFIDNWRWQGVPFYLTSGKRLAKKLTEIQIHFREVPHSIFRHVIGQRIHKNVLTLGIHPDEKISLVFQTKNPGATLRLRPVTMDFHYSQNYAGPLLDAYEKALIDCMRGDQMLFWRQDAVELTWSFLSPILERCETCTDRSRMIFPYEAGTWGPAEASRLEEG